MNEAFFKSLNLDDVCMFPDVFLDSGRICDTCDVRNWCKCKCKQFVTSAPKNRKVVSKDGNIETNP